MRYTTKGLVSISYFHSQFAVVQLFLYPWHEVYRGYIVFAFSVIVFVCLSVCKLFFSVKDFSATIWVKILKFGTKLDSDELYYVTKTATYCLSVPLFFKDCYLTKEHAEWTVKLVSNGFDYYINKVKQLTVTGNTRRT